MLDGIVYIESITSPASRVVRSRWRCCRVDSPLIRCWWSRGPIPRQTTLGCYADRV